MRTKESVRDVENRKVRLVFDSTTTRLSFIVYEGDEYTCIEFEGNDVSKLKHFIQEAEQAVEEETTDVGRKTT